MEKRKKNQDSAEKVEWWRMEGDREGQLGRGRRQGNGRKME